MSTDRMPGPSAATPRGRRHERGEQAQASQGGSAKPKAAKSSAGKPGAAKSATAGAAGARSAATTDATAESAKARKPQRDKLVRDSFTMPRSDFALIAALKERALDFRRPARKSELLRAGLHALAALDDARLRAALDGLAPVKKGRPKRED